MSNPIRHVLGISGGKDSAALAIYVKTKYPNIDLEFYSCDTGKELDETYQRFLNILCKGTYVRPHRHTNPPKAETFLILEGNISFLIFSDQGEIIESHILQAGGSKYGIDILPGVWHSLVCISDTAVCFEGKHGPYNPANDKDFASWAPLENTEEAKQYLSLLEKGIIS